MSADPGLITAAELQGKDFPPVRWVVPDLIPEGLTILAGKPKLGKSWLVLDVALAVARGGWTLGDRHCARGSVLYAALEDGQRRLKERMRKVCASESWPAGLAFRTEIPNLGAGGLDQLAGWIDGARDPRLIIVDTFAKVRPAKTRDETQYEADYRAAGLLKTLADKTGVGVIIVHHVRKMEADDPLDAVSGTNGLTGAADTILVLKRDGSGVTLYGRGRDIEEQELALEFRRQECRWSVLGSADEVHRSDERKAIIDALRDSAEPMSPREIADVTEHAYGATRKLLHAMTRDGEVKKLGRGRYGLP
jgi:RecA-family ATPase